MPVINQLLLLQNTKLRKRVRRCLRISKKGVCYLPVTGAVAPKAFVAWGGTAAAGAAISTFATTTITSTGCSL